MSMEENRKLLLTHNNVPSWNTTIRNYPTSSSSSSSSSSEIPYSISSLSLEVEPNKSCKITTPSPKGKGKGKEEVNNNNNNNNKENGDEEEEVTGRERLKRHREEVKGNVKIPEDWGQEKLLKDWIDYTTFDALLAPRHRLIVAARDALIADARKPARSQRLRIHI